jgi:hypothetical protein
VDSFSSYSDHSGLNTHLFSGEFASRHDDGKLRLGYDISFRELNQNSFAIRPSLGALKSGLVRRDVFATTALAEANISQKMAVATSITFSRYTYKIQGYADSENLTVPIDLFYRWTSKTDLSVGYRFRETRVRIGQDSTDHFLNIGARGEFTPKIAGRFAVGVNRRDLERGGADTQVGVDATLAYEVTPKTTFEFGASNDFGTSPQGQQLKNKSVRGMLVAKIAEEWSLSGGLNWRAIDYGARTDDYVEAQLGSAFVVSTSVRIEASYVFRNYSSNVRFNEFRNNVFSVAVHFRH